VPYGPEWLGVEVLAAMPCRARRPFNDRHSYIGASVTGDRTFVGGRIRHAMAIQAVTRRVAAAATCGDTYITLTSKVVS
jgi:hypothetical protein